MDPRSRSPAKDTAGPGVEKDTTGMGWGRRPSRGSEAVGPMPDTYGYRSTRPEPGNGGLGAAPRGEGLPSERYPEGRLVIHLRTVFSERQNTNPLDAEANHILTQNDIQGHSRSSISVSMKSTEGKHSTI